MVLLRQPLSLIADRKYFYALYEFRNSKNFYFSDVNPQNKVLRVPQRARKLLNNTELFEAGGVQYPQLKGAVSASLKLYL